MSGIQYVTDEQGRKVAVQIDLKTHRELWEDIEDVLVSRARRHEKRIPLDQVKADSSRAVSSRVSSYRVALTTSAEKELQWLPAKMVARIMPRLEHLASVPRPPGCQKLRGGRNEWRIRVGAPARG